MIVLFDYTFAEVVMNGLDFILKYLPLLIPLLLIELGLMIYCLVDIARREKTKGPKWMWILIVVLVNLLGSIAYLIIGREE
jgi:Phospholipase_D-nuclease N-terminal